MSRMPTTPPSSVEHFIDSSIYAYFQEQQYLLAKKKLHYFSLLDQDVLNTLFTA